MRRAWPAYVVAGVLTIVGGAPAAPLPEPERPTDVVRYEHDRLTLRTEHMTRAEVVRQLAAASGASVRGDMPAGDVSVTLESVPLTVALDRILGKQSYMLTYKGDGTLRAIEMLGAGVPVVVTPVPPGARSSPAPHASIVQQRAAAPLQRELPVSQQLIESLGGDPPTIERLLHAVVGESRADLRAEAREALLNAITTHPEIEAAYLASLGPVEDGALLGALRAQSSADGAAEWFGALAVRAHNQELKRKANAVLGELQRAKM
jgi:hypothetical protein